MRREGGFEFDRGSLDDLAAALERLERGFAELPASAGPLGAPEGSVRAVLLETASRLTDNYPYFHPLYAGQMLKPPHPVARLAYALAMWINPNNHALDGGRASSAMEKEAVAALAKLFGWSDHLGHLCGGGTMANLEALWVAGRLAPGRTVARVVAGALHAPAHLRGARPSVRGRSRRPARPHGRRERWPAGSSAAASERSSRRSARPRRGRSIRCRRFWS